MSNIRNILVCIPQTGPMYYKAFTESYTHAKNYLMQHAELLPFDFALAEYFCHTFPIDANRNECVAVALRHDIDQTIWLDTDQEFGKETLLKLLLPDQPIVAGIYHGKNEPYHPIVFKESEKSTDFNVFNSVQEFPEKELFEADMIGMGCVAIKTEVFRALENPWFKYQKHPIELAEKGSLHRFKAENEITDVSEDVWFWKQVRHRTDYRILIDPQIMVNHLGIMKIGRGIWRSFRDAMIEQVLTNKGEEFVSERMKEECKATPAKLSSAS